MTMQSVGPIAALSVASAIDDAERITTAVSVGACSA
jgi:hypothetical protein